MKIAVSGLALIGTLSLSGCISSAVTSDISAPQPLVPTVVPVENVAQADLTQQNATTLELAQNLSNIPSASLPVPSVAPRPELALTSEPATSTEVAIAQTSQVIATAQQTPAAPEIIQTTALVEPAPKKLNLFQRLALRAKERKAAEAAQALAASQKAEATRVAKIEAANKQTASAEALPGVKKGSSLFGIGTSEEPKEEVKVASVGGYSRSLSKHGLILQTSSVKVECFKPELLRVLKIVEKKYKKRVMVTSGYRSPERNRRAGGVRNSAHVYCKAADIQVEGVSKWDLAKYLRTIPGRGGVGTYCRTNSVHIDTGPQRGWHHPCRRSRSKKKS